MVCLAWKFGFAIGSDKVAGSGGVVVSVKTAHDPGRFSLSRARHALLYSGPARTRFPSLERCPSG